VGAADGHKAFGPGHRRQVDQQAHAHLARQPLLAGQHRLLLAIQ